MHGSFRRITRAVSLPVILGTSLMPAMVVLLMLLLSGTHERREISLHIVEAPDGLMTLGSGQANTPEEEAILRQTRDALGRPGLKAPVRITEVVSRRGLGLPLEQGSSPLLAETSRTYDISVLILASMGGSQMFYRTGSGIDEDGGNSLLDGLPPELLERMGRAPIEDLDAEYEIDRVLQALAELARTSTHLRLAATADLIAEGGGKKTVENTPGTVVVFVIATALTLLVMIPLLVVRFKIIAMADRGLHAQDRRDPGRLDTLP